MSLFDLAVEINRGLALRRAAKALAAGCLEDFQRALKPGLPVNALVPARLFYWIGIQTRAPKTTLLLAASMMPTEVLPTSDRHQAMDCLLGLGADPFMAVPGDKRNTVDHVANRHDLDGWRLLARHSALGDRVCRHDDATRLNWPEAQDWIRRDLAASQCESLEKETPLAHGRRGQPRL